jgi:hypothetical protein
MKPSRLCPSCDLPLSGETRNLVGTKLEYHEHCLRDLERIQAQALRDAKGKVEG